MKMMYLSGFFIGCVGGYLEEAALPYIVGGFCLGLFWGLVADDIMGRHS